MRGQEADPGRRSKPGGGNLVLAIKLYTVAQSTSNDRSTTAHGVVRYLNLGAS